MRFYLEGKPQTQVAAELGCSVDAVKTRVHEGLEHLRVFFARKGLALGAVALASGLASEATASEPALVATCVQTVLTPAAAPGAAALANGVITAMIIKTATLIAAGLVLAGSCLTAALVVGAESAPTPVAVPVPPTSVPAAPAVVKPAWASEIGTDQYGTWADLKVAEVTQRFRWIQPGTFTMGSSQEEKDGALALDPGRYPEWLASEVPHQVTLTQGFWLADSACTQALWQVITGSNPASFKDSPQNPVEQVSWDDCQQFLSTLNGRVSGGGFRLPSEAQWEYACRAGTTTAFSFGSTITPEQVNYDGNYPFAGAAKGLHRQITVSVKSLPPNAWGLYEMHGNVWQWCNDWYGDFSGGAERDPAGPSSGVIRVVRGGSWGFRASDCRSAFRFRSTPGLRVWNVGFRIACLAGGETADAKKVVETNHPEDTFSAPRTVMEAFYKAVTNNTYEAYRMCLHPETRKIGEYGSEEAMRFWRKQFDKLKKRGFDGVWQFEEVPSTLATPREPVGSVKAYPVLGEKPYSEYCLMILIEGEWKIARLF